MKLKRVKETFKESRPAVGGGNSMVGESYTEYMLGAPGLGNNPGTNLLTPSPIKKQQEFGDEVRRQSLTSPSGGPSPNDNMNASEMSTQSKS